MMEAAIKKLITALKSLDMALMRLEKKLREMYPDIDRQLRMVPITQLDCRYPISELESMFYFLRHGDGWGYWATETHEDPYSSMHQDPPEWATHFTYYGK